MMKTTKRIGNKLIVSDNDLACMKQAIIFLLEEYIKENTKLINKYGDFGDYGEGINIVTSGVIKARELLKELKGGE